MDRKQMCVANVQYKKPSASQSKQMKNLVKYLTYREGRDQGAPQVRGRARWTNLGMGGSVAEIAELCEAYKSQHVLLFSLVVNPNPDLIALVPHEQREQFVRQLTERTVEGFFAARGIDNGVEWSAVLHHRQTDDPQSPGQHNPHMHVILPGTYYDEDAGERMPLYFTKNRNADHFVLLHEITEEQTTALMDKYVGREWERRIDKLEAVREAQRSVTSQPANGVLVEEGTEWDFWCGVRRTDERTSAAGYYRYVPANDDHVEPQFRPLIDNLSHKEAELLSQLFRAERSRDFNRLQPMAYGIKDMSREQRDDFFRELRSLDLDIPRYDRGESGRLPDLDISF